MVYFSSWGDSPNQSSGINIRDIQADYLNIKMNEKPRLDYIDAVSLIISVGAYKLVVSEVPFVALRALFEFLQSGKQEEADIASISGE